MSVKVHIGQDGREAIVTIAGRFDFGIHEEFRTVLDALKGKTLGKYTIDLGAVEDMDSAALGMLLLLRDTVGGDKANIILARCRTEVRDMLKMANFHELFKIL